MSASTDTPLTGLDLWSPNDYSNFITISAAAIGTTLLVIFKSKCSTISLCFGLVSCDRQVGDDDTDEEQPVPLPQAPQPQQPQPPDQPPQPAVVAP